MECEDVDRDLSGCSKAERKVRKSLAGLGLRRVPGIERVVVGRAKEAVFSILNPQVYMVPGSDSYMVFGEAKLGNFQLPDAPTGPRAGNEEVPTPAKIEEVRDAAEESQLEERDIQVVMAQCSVSRAQAIQALTENGGDIVNAIMSFSG